MVDWYTLGIAIFAAIGSGLFGYDTGIATTTIAHQSWIEYMGKPSNGLTGAVVALYVRILSPYLFVLVGTNETRRLRAKRSALCSKRR